MQSITKPKPHRVSLDEDPFFRLDAFKYIPPGLKLDYHKRSTVYLFRIVIYKQPYILYYTTTQKTI